jgi:hypothetical protein
LLFQTAEMPRVIPIFVFISIIASCSKDNSGPLVKETPQAILAPSAQDYYPLTKGNYWVYDYYNINTNTNSQTFWYRDSVWIVGDTTINGYKYAHQEAKSSNGATWWAYLRDSLGYMVTYREEKIRFSCNNFTDTLNIKHDFPYTVYAKMVHKDTLIITPIGNFHSISLGYIWYYINKPDPLPKNEYLFFAKGVGMTQYCHWYYPTCITKIEGRLIKYHLN